MDAGNRTSFATGVAVRSAVTLEPIQRASGDPTMSRSR